MVVRADAPATLLDLPHHDGSDAYVLERPDELGGKATVRLRVPREPRRRTRSFFVPSSTASRATCAQ